MSAAFDMTSQDRSLDEPFDPGSHYRAIASAIDLIVESYQDQPSLEDMAAVAGMSPFHSSASSSAGPASAPSASPSSSRWGTPSGCSTMTKASWVLRWR